MYDQLEKYIAAYTADIPGEEEVWYANGLEEAIEYLEKFTDDDWKKLFQELFNKPKIWQDRFVSLMENPNDYNQLKVVMSFTDDAYGNIHDSVIHYFAKCDSIINSIYRVILREIESYLPDRLYEFDIKSLIDKYRDKYKNIEKKTDVVIYADTIEQEALEQIRNLVNQEAFKYSKIRIMPDVHAGKSCVIGFTGDLGEKVIPSIVGVDIGCGMLCASLGVIDIDYKKLDEYISKNIPSGHNINDEKVVDFKLDELYCYDKLKNVDLLEKSIGTLGGGNHFIEIDEYTTGEKFLVVHTGSRNLGAQVAHYYQDLADQICNYKILEQEEERREVINSYKESGREKEIQHALEEINEKYKDKKGSIPYEFTYLEGKYRDAYLHDMKICQEYAKLNRYVIASKIAEYMGWDLDDYFESVHNYISFDDNIVRKGAISAKKDEMVIIPINMRDGCIIGVGKGNPEWNYSAPHGAGRMMSRSKAKELLKIDDYKKSMNNVYTTSVNEETIDEAPDAYKPLDEILKYIDETIYVRGIVKAVYNYKESGTQVFNLTDEEEHNKVR